MGVRVKKEVKFRHGLLAFGLLAIVMFGCVVGLGSEPQIPMVFGCLIAGCIAMYLGFSWDEVLDSMVKGIVDSLEAILILLCIGMLVGVWIISGTVPTMIYYGLQVVTPQLFLPICFIVTLIVGIVLGSWGAAGTIGIAFIGIAAALGIPLPMAAGAIVAAAYVSEIVSPLVDGPNLAAAISDCKVFDLCKRFLGVAVIVCLGCVAVYTVMGSTLDVSNAVDGPTDALLTALSQSYDIGPLTLIPLAVMVVCIALKVPAIPSFLLAVIIGMVEAVFLQHADLSAVVAAANTGVVSQTGFDMIDTLLSTGGIEEMLPTISIVVLVMAYGGIMQHTGLMASLVKPVIDRLKSFAALVSATVFSGAAFNILLPDQYPAITMSAQMYRDEFRRRGVDNEVWGNFVNSSAGITSVLVPWNTCAIYMVTILGVPCIEYAPFAIFCYAFPIAVIIIAVLFGKKIGWLPRSASDR